MNDVIIVGSGAGGVHAAWPLAEAGLRVLMLDYGAEDSRYAPMIPPKPFSAIRREEPDQSRYFLGENLEGVPFGDVRVGAQLTPPRAFVTAETERLLPAICENFSAMQSLARGGLASAWGAVVFPYLEEDLRGMPISLADLQPHYDAVAERIGVCGEDDDLAPYVGAKSGLLPPARIDTNAESLLARYQKRRVALNARGFHLGRPRMALCTAEHRGRGPCRCRDMEFWDDLDRAVYRPRWTLEELERFPNFKRLSGRLVGAFAEDADAAIVSARDAQTGEAETHRARAVVLAAGTFGTARIALRSFGRHETKLPFVCNPYTYLPALNLNMLGRAAADERHSLSQLSAIYQAPGGHGAEDGDDLVQAQWYSYRALLTFKLLKESPLPFREGLRAMRALLPMIGILGIHHADRPSPGKFCQLEQGAPGEEDRLRIHYELTDDEERLHDRRERELAACFRKLRCWPIKSVRPGHGSSIHYAGTLPMSASEKELTTTASGLLRPTRSVYVADGSVFPRLTAKGLTFTLMANANRVGAALAQRLAGRVL